MFFYVTGTYTIFLSPHITTFLKTRYVELYFFAIHPRPPPKHKYSPPKKQKIPHFFSIHPQPPNSPPLLESPLPGPLSFLFSYLSSFSLFHFTLPQPSALHTAQEEVEEQRPGKMSGITGRAKREPENPLLRKT